MSAFLLNVIFLSARWITVAVFFLMLVIWYHSVLNNIWERLAYSLDRFLTLSISSCSAYTWAHPCEILLLCDCTAMNKHFHRCLMLRWTEKADSNDKTMCWFFWRKLTHKVIFFHHSSLFLSTCHIWNVSSSEVSKDQNQRALYLIVALLFIIQMD